MLDAAACTIVPSAIAQLVTCLSEQVSYVEARSVSREDRADIPGLLGFIDRVLLQKSESLHVATFRWHLKRYEVCSAAMADWASAYKEAENATGEAYRGPVGRWELFRDAKESIRTCFDALSNYAERALNEADIKRANKRKALEEAERHALKISLAEKEKEIKARQLAARLEGEASRGGRRISLKDRFVLWINERDELKTALQGVKDSHRFEQALSRAR